MDLSDIEGESRELDINRERSYCIRRNEFSNVFLAKEMIVNPSAT